jgi:hypothetical protein
MREIIQVASFDGGLFGAMLNGRVAYAAPAGALRAETPQSRAPQPRRHQARISASRCGRQRAVIRRGIEKRDGTCQCHTRALAECPTSR